MGVRSFQGSGEIPRVAKQSGLQAATTEAGAPAARALQQEERRRWEACAPRPRVALSRSS